MKLNSKPYNKSGSNKIISIKNIFKADNNSVSLYRKIHNSNLSIDNSSEYSKTLSYNNLHLLGQKSLINKSNLKSKILNLEIINNINFQHKTLCINSNGLEDSKRNANDGYVFFGYETKNKKNSNPKIDVFLITKDKELTDEVFNEIHFQIPKVLKEA